MCTESAAKIIPNFSYGHPKFELDLSEILVGLIQLLPTDFKILILSKIPGVIAKAEGGHFF